MRFTTTTFPTFSPPEVWWNWHEAADSQNTNSILAENNMPHGTPPSSHLYKERRRPPNSEDSAIPTTSQVIKTSFLRHNTRPFNQLHQLASQLQVIIQWVLTYKIDHPYSQLIGNNLNNSHKHCRTSNASQTHHPRPDAPDLHRRPCGLLLPLHLQQMQLQRLPERRQRRWRQVQEIGFRRCLCRSVFNVQFETPVHALHVLGLLRGRELAECGDQIRTVVGMYEFADWLGEFYRLWVSDILKGLLGVFFPV